MVPNDMIGYYMLCYDRNKLTYSCYDGMCYGMKCCD